MFRGIIGTARKIAFYVPLLRLKHLSCDITSTLTNCISGCTRVEASKEGSLRKLNEAIMGMQDLEFLVFVRTLQRDNYAACHFMRREQLAFTPCLKSIIVSDSLSQRLGGLAGAGVGAYTTGQNTVPST